MENIVVGVDIGGSHVSAHLINLKEKAEIDNTWVRNKLDSNASAEDIINVWASTIEASLKDHQITPGKINVSIPGPMDYDTGVCMIKGQGKYEKLYGLNLKVLLSKRLSYDINRIHLVNDAACFLKGELFGGSLKGVDQAIGITLGTGLGTAHIANGMAVDSDLWQMPFGEGIAEDYISTRWFVSYFKSLSGIKIDNVEDLIKNHQDSPWFKPVFKEFSRNLSKFVHEFIQLKKPSAGVLGGNITNAKFFFLDDTRNFLNELIGYEFPLETSVLGEKAMTMGAGASSF